MGLLSGAASALSIAGSVGQGVFSLVKGGTGLIGTIAKSKIGKFAIGAGAAAILLSDPSNKGNSLFSRIGEGFKSLLGTLKDTVVSKVSTAGITAATAVTGIGVASKDTMESLQSSVADSEDMAQAEGLADGAQAAPVQEQEAQPGSWQADYA